VRIVPEKSNGLLSHRLDGPIRVVIAVGAGENENAKFHGFSFIDALPSIDAFISAQSALARAG
jgi:hypothetical protein